jgi:hypothetical protein
VREQATAMRDRPEAWLSRFSDTFYYGRIS